METKQGDIFSILEKSKLSTRAMLMDLSIHGWGARRRDRTVGYDVAERAGAEHDAGNYNKLLVPKSYIDPLTRQSARVRNIHKNFTLPWSDDGGPRILPTAMVSKYYGAMREVLADREKSVEGFLSCYMSLVNDAPRRLGTLYNSRDYPSQREMAKKFWVNLTPVPFPDSRDFRVDLNPGEVEKMRDDLDRRIDDAVAGISADLFGRLRDCIARIADRCAIPHGAKDPGGKSIGKFTDSMILNLRDLLDLLPGLNVTEDPDLCAIADVARVQLAGINPGTLRTDSTARTSAAAAAAAILEKMAGYIGGAK